jgi:acyl-coenzyme A synthetase/AMP-(fatty) acid ligase
LIHLWKNFHSKELVALLKKCWDSDDLLILCSPHVSDFSFVDDLSDAVLATFPERAVLGVFTTGTVSGAPRLVLYSKKNIESSLASLFSLFDDQQIEEVFCYPQPFHTFGLTLGYLYSILKNKKLSFPDGPYTQSAHTLRADIQHEKVLTLGTPAHFFDLISQVESGKISLHPSYSAIIGGAKVSTKLWHELQTKLKILSPSIGYGASEACPGVTHLPPGTAPKEDGEIGFPLPNLKLELKPGMGIEFSGENLCVAILEKGELSFPKKVLLTDQVEKRADGRLVYVGRTSLIINRGGTKYSIEALEALLLQKLNHRCACFAVEDPRLGEEVGVLLESKIDEADARATLQDACRKVLAAHFGHHFGVPEFHLTSELPFNANGKIDRKQVAKLVRPEP